MHADSGHQVYSVSSDTLVQLASGLIANWGEKIYIYILFELEGGMDAQIQTIENPLTLKSPDHRE
jgi:hypothetical protein